MPKVSMIRNDCGEVRRIKVLVSDSNEARICRGLVGAYGDGLCITFHASTDILDQLSSAYGEGLTVSADTLEWYYYEMNRAKESAHLALQANANLNNCPTEIVTNLRPYQAVGAQWLSTMGRGLLCDEVGLGKTVQVCMALQETRSRKTLISAPVYVLDHWANNLDKWYPGVSYRIIEGSPKKKLELLDDDVNVYLVSHATLRDKKYSQLWSTKWDTFVIDEAHRFRNRKSKQSIGAAEIKSSHLYLLTGTPVENMSDDLWHLLHMINPREFSSYWTFINRYFDIRDGHFGKEIIGVSDPDGIHDIVGKYMLRRKKRSVLTDLPLVRHQTVAYDLEPRSKKIYTEALKAYKDDGQYNSFMALTVELRKICNCSEEKSKVILEILQDTPGKVVIYTWHHSMVDHITGVLSEGKINHVCVTGMDSVDIRHKALDKFRDPQSGVDVLVGTIASMGTGIDLVEASTAIFAEHDWLGTNNEQAVGRLDRIGQKSSPMIYHLISPGTVEANIYYAAVNKDKSAEKTLQVDLTIERLAKEYMK